jgi:ABC-type phosphate transport system permease subunit
MPPKCRCAGEKAPLLQIAFNDKRTSKRMAMFLVIFQQTPFWIFLWNSKCAPPLHSEKVMTGLEV